MTTKPNPPDAAIDKTLAALNSAQPPAGMEARIAARLAQNREQPAPALSWRRRLLGSSLASAWCSGAATGAAVAMLAFAALFLLHHATRATPHSQIAVKQPAPAPTATPVSAATAAPCLQPAVLRVRKPSHAPAVETASSAAPARSSTYAVSSGSLTAQERAAIRFAQIADPKTLASLNPEYQARLEAEDTQQFQKFFAPPPRPPQPQPAAQPAPPGQSATPAVNPEPNPEPGPVGNQPGQILN